MSDISIMKQDTMIRLQIRIPEPHLLQAQLSLIHGTIMLKYFTILVMA